MVSKEDFNKVWKDSSRENILNQFYYEHYELFRIKKEVSEFVEKWKYVDGDGSVFFDINTNPDDLLKILDKGE